MPTMSTTAFEMLLLANPDRIAKEICAIQPMVSLTGKIFSMKPKHERFSEVNKLVCLLSDILTETWTTHFEHDEHLLKSLVLLLRDTASLDANAQETRSSVSYNETMSLFEELYNLVDYITTNYPDITFDMTMRGFPIVFTKDETNS